MRDVLPSDEHHVAVPRTARLAAASQPMQPPSRSRPEAPSGGWQRSRLALRVAEQGGITVAVLL